MRWTKKKIIGLLLIALLAIGLPVAVFLVRQQQDIRQRAANEVTISFDPQQVTKNIGEEFDVKVQVNGGTANVSYVKMNLKYDEEFVDYVSFVPAGNYAFISGPTPTSTGDLNFELVDASTTAPTGLVEVGVLKLRGRASGIANLAVAGSELYATGINGALSLTNVTAGQYTIASTNPLSPSPDCPATDKPLTCTCTQDTECNSNKCSPLPNDPNISVCVPYLSPNPTLTEFPTLPPSLPPSFTPTPTLTNTPTPTATETPTPTNTPVPTETRLTLSTSLLGIGLATGDTTNPVHPNREATIQIFNNINEIVKDATGTLVYKPATGRYEGTISLGTNYTTGSYYIKLKFNGTLLKRLPGIAQITQGSDQNTALYAPLVSGDLNGDNSLTIADYTTFVACYRNESTCTQQYKDLADFNDDGIVTGDNVDLNILQSGFAVREGD